MIYLQNTSESQEMFIPRNGESPQGNLVFKAKSTIDLVEFNQGVTILHEGLYFHLAIEIPADVPNGEYEYTLLSGNIPVSSGLLVIGDYTKPSEYNKEIIYEQYETER